MQAVEVHSGNASTRERILSAARKVFLDGSPEHATMDALAQEAGMSKKTIYREFKSQFELLAALAADSVADLGAFPAPTARDDIELELYGLLVRLVSAVTSPRAMALARLFISEVRRYPDLINHNKPKSFPQSILATWLAAPAVRARYQIEDPADAAAMLIGMIIQDAGFKLLFTNDAEALPLHLIEQRARRAVTIFLRGVSK